MKLPASELNPPACEVFTLALQVYTPPWLVRRGSKVSTLVLGEERAIVTPSIVPFWISCPPGPNNILISDALRGCSKVAAQVTVSGLPAVKSPLMVMFNTAGSTGERGRKGGGMRVVNSY